MGGISTCVSSDFMSVVDQEEALTVINRTARVSRRKAMNCGLSLVENYQAPASRIYDPAVLMELLETLPPGELREVLKERFGLSS